MFRFLALLFLLIFSFKSYAVYELSFNHIWGNWSGQCPAGKHSFNTCFPNKTPLTLDNGETYYVCNSNGGRVSIANNPYKNGCTSYIYLSEAGTAGCADIAELTSYANYSCSSTSQTVFSMDESAIPQCIFECGDVLSPSEECENTVTQQCASNGGFGSSNFLDDGAGSTSCSGVCGDGSIAGAEPEPEPDCSVAPFCDVPDPDGNSDLDFGSGGSGSDVLPPSSSSGDVEHDIDYEPDGSTADSSTGMSTLQGDKLINEVVKSRNDNTTNLVSTTQSTNETIVEKSDDIQNTIANSANGIIDAIHGIDTNAPFNDGNIVGAINSLGDKIDGLGDNLTDPLYDATPTTSFTYQSLFDTASIDSWVYKTNILKVDINLEMQVFETALKDTMSFSTNANGYAPNNLDLGQWGAHDISLSRFADFFGGVGNIIFFLASLTALSIVLGGIKL
ncbi:MAG: hypothetical protein MJK15_07760 [Colwellia sp.]|nr:hypothetical protein [Colwellia sp.]